MAAQQSQGIQTLLEAEKEASKTVQQARDYRLQRFKEARAEASREIEKYKAAKKTDFDGSEASRVSTTSNTEAALNQTTADELKKIDSIFERKKDDVEQSIFARAILVEPELHRNLKKTSA